MISLRLLLLSVSAMRGAFRGEGLGRAGRLSYQFTP
ncbi:hypothetical protein RLO149_c033890 [Roseobacter litoralis Och 149]|uniref:Uncharacterized protein n=1 Tax=Roseobacter litoralis (strain ATCC 49566 / DSM 6996 / JCM 21268 / NBRC 15278 / OCh 149) TaxID=391595 RepID=F7ZLT6_ROSLO|nr:hypothetical protein RLO149_c033890 [Roseobacter litoralis Och 149]